MSLGSCLTERITCRRNFLLNVFCVKSGEKVVLLRGVSSDGFSFFEGEEVRVTDNFSLCFEPGKEGALKLGVWVESCPDKEKQAYIPIDALTINVKAEGKGE